MPETSSDRIEPTFVDIILPLEQSEDTKAQKAAVAAKLNTKISQIVELRLRKHSIDARQRKIKVQLRFEVCLLYTSPSPRDLSTSRMPSSA